MASSFLEHMGFAVCTVVYLVHQMQCARLAVETVHFMQWEQPDKRQVVWGQVFCLEEGKFLGNSSSVPSSLQNGGSLLISLLSSMVSWKALL